VQKIAVFTYRSPHFCFPCDYHAICCMDGKTIQCLPNLRSMYLSIFNSFQVIIRCLSQYVTREFDAYKLSRCMCPSSYNRFWDRARYWTKIVIFSYPLAFDAPLGGFSSEYRHPVPCGKTRMVSLPDGEKISKICLFVLTWSTNVTDGRTDTACRHIPRFA